MPWICSNMRCIRSLLIFVVCVGKTLWHTSSLWLFKAGSYFYWCFKLLRLLWHTNQVQNLCLWLMFVVLYIYMLSVATILLNWQSQNISEFRCIQKFCLQTFSYSAQSLPSILVYCNFEVVRLKTYPPELDLLIVTANQAHVEHRIPRIPWTRYSIISVMQF